MSTAPAGITGLDRIAQAKLPVSDLALSAQHRPARTHHPTPLLRQGTGPRPCARPDARRRSVTYRATVDYIAWFNGTRLHSALGYLTPNELTSSRPAPRPTRKPSRR
jgi:hypothetical protein